MHIQVPSQIGLDSLVKDIHHVGATHSHMMLETVLADILHQFLQVVDFRNGDTAVHSVGIVGDLTLAEIGLDDALRVVGRDAEEGKWTF